MPNIKPISDLRSYTAVLVEVAQGSPVFLTKNGRGRYVIQDISDYEHYEAEKALLAQLDYGKRVADERGTLTTEQVRGAFSERSAPEIQVELAWSPAAVDDLEAAVDCIESELASPMAARSLVDSVIGKAQLFADVPGAGTALRALNGIDTGYRYMVSGNWMVFLSCGSGRALVVRVLYAKSDYMRTLFGKIDSER